MKRLVTIVSASVWLALLPVTARAVPAADENTAVVSAQAGGAITGTVSNGATGAYLEGAEVVLQPGNVSVLTARDGKFAFTRVPAGEYHLTVTYTGLDARTIPVKVTGDTASVNEVALTSEVYQLAPFVVESDREGNALAITQQRNAPNVKNVISSDAFGDVADLNLGNFLQRVPGFSTEISEGEVVRVQIRGTSADLNAVTVDGTRAANGSTRTFARGFEIDKIPIDFIDTVEITKAATPDMDADSIGGAVNLKTKSALDIKGRRITFQYGENYNWAQKTFRPAANAAYADHWLDGRLGVIFTASYNESDQPRDANGITWQSTKDLDAPAWFNADTFGSDKVSHTRGGASVRFDYKLGDATRLYFSTQYSYYADQLDRHWGRLSTPGAANILSISDRVVETKNQQFKFYQYFRNRDLITANFTLGGESEVWGGKLDFSANYSPSKGTDRDRTFPVRYVDGVGFREERSLDNKFITLTQISGPDILDWRNSQFSYFQKWGNVSKDSILGAQVNYRKPLPFTIPVSIKTGARFRAETREQNINEHLYDYVGPNGVDGPHGPNDDDDLARFFDPNYDYRPNSGQPKNGGLNLDGQFFDLGKLNDALRDTPQYFKENLTTGTKDSIKDDTKVSEQVTAAYVMGDVQLGRLGIVGGVRLEDTRLTGHGYKQEVTPEEKARRASWVGPVTPEETVRRTEAEFNNPTERSGHYQNFFPSIHFKYRLAKGLIARASYSTGIGRPNFSSIVPSYTVNDDNQTVVANNPDLKPQYGRSYDATLEYYFEPAGLVSVAVFQKDLSDFIFRQSAGQLGPDNPFGAGYDGYMLTTDFNGGSARIRGLELNYQQQFTNLPGFWKGFGVFANFTWQETRGDYGKTGTVTTQNELPNFTPRGGNFGLTYIGYGWTVRALVNYTDDRLLAYSADPSQRQYLMAAAPVDFNVAYDVSQHFRVYVDVINAFNAGRQYQYKGTPNHRSDTWVYTPVVKFGVMANF
jgi:TonB-dependent receptor